MACKTPEGVVTGNRGDRSHIHKGLRKSVTHRESTVASLDPP